MKGIYFTRCKCVLFTVIMLAAGLLAASPQVSLAQIFRRYEPCVPCPTTPSTGTTQPASPSLSGTGAVAPSPSPGGGTNESNPAADLFAQQDVGAAGGAASAAPNMVGDFFGAGAIVITSGTNSSTAVLPGGAVPRYKMAEDTSPLPQNRVFFDYDHYHDVPINNPAIDVNAYTPGFEKTFFCGMMSFEMRLPMASTLDNNVFLDGTTRTNVGEIGDLAMALKCLVIETDTFACSGGLAMTVPTAKGSQYFAGQGSPFPSVTISNQSVHLMPFVGGLWTPNDRLFAIGYFQVDVDASGDTVTGGNSFIAPTTAIGRYRDPTLLYLDLSVGYWLRRCDCAGELVTGFAPVMELHMNQTLDAPSTPNGTTFPTSVTAVSNTFSILDLTVGAHVELRKNTTLTAGYCTPLTSQREFDGQFRLLMNYRF